MQLTNNLRNNQNYVLDSDKSSLLLDYNGIYFIEFISFFVGGLGYYVLTLCINLINFSKDLIIPLVMILLGFISTVFIVIFCRFYLKKRLLLKLKKEYLVIKSQLMIYKDFVEYYSWNSRGTIVTKKVKTRGKEGILFIKK